MRLWRAQDSLDRVKTPARCRVRVYEVFVRNFQWSPKWSSKLSLFGAGALSVLLTSAQAGNQICVNCELMARTQQVGNTAVTSGVQEMGVDIAAILQKSNLIRFPSLAQAGVTENARASGASSAQAQASAQAPLWDGSGPIPGAFKRGFEWAPTDFNPSFKTDFYTSEGGLVNTAAAPWNLYLPPDLARLWYGPIQTMPQTVAASFPQVQAIPQVLPQRF